MFNVGGGEILAILVIALIVLGPDKLPNAARQAGKYLNEFRRISSGFQDELRGAMDLATTNDPTPVVMEPAAAVDTADSSDERSNDDGPDDGLETADLDVADRADPGVASETVAFADHPEHSTNGTATDPTDPPGSDSGSMSPETPPPDPPPASSGDLAEAELAVTRARLAEAQAELAEAEAKLALAKAEPATDLTTSAGPEATDATGSLPPDPARA